MSIKLLLELKPFCQYYKARFKEKTNMLKQKRGGKLKCVSLGEWRILTLENEYHILQYPATDTFHVLQISMIQTNTSQF